MDYNKQANDFLSKYGISMHIGKGTEKKAPWVKDVDCGLCYMVRLMAFDRASISFPFWNSIDAKRKGIAPKEYDILACISGDINCADTFDDFCSDLGYNPDSISDMNTFKRCRSFAKKLKSFFTEEEIEALQEIQ